MNDILNLSNELLLQVGLYFGDASSLQSLSLTCRCLRPVAQEALIRTATLSPRNI
jgi:hypothetical protein